MSDNVIDLEVHRRQKLDSDLYCIIYVSYHTGPSIGVDLPDILKSARAFNTEHDITGLLLAHKGVFMQVLEGRQGDVEACYDRISEDRRHKGLRILRSEKIEKRTFETWDMAFVPFQELSDKQKDNFVYLGDLASTDKLQNLPHDPKTKLFIDSFFTSIQPSTVTFK
ncbi:BLUF domain-containing protein [Kordiimonas sp. SCSIO 12610]|uniref:BLUF domain-containing protein n=1 Tax=Kordiimonas sp. SCSIO 12610 TaxID=2829597 RepID=UPI0021098E98|nr:BLUF domain-containing protein [Kordiimonas sp. SCSIO 12610]UTW56025.1 BLUF domain-containing protein [Kordiimonas sp. SCSIO 12610]